MLGMLGWWGVIRRTGCPEAEACLTARLHRLHTVTSMSVLSLLLPCRTNKYFVRKVRAAADSTCEHKVLMPYGPHAPRNRPKETVRPSAVQTQYCSAGQGKVE